VEELQERAEDLGIEARALMNKDELITACASSADSAARRSRSGASGRDRSLGRELSDAGG
jgi:hypothetical protein